MAQPKTLTKPGIDLGTSRKMDNGRDYNVLIWNDDISTTDEVVRALLEVCGLPIQLAVSVMLDAHTSGKAIAKTTAFEMAEAMRDGLESKGLTATLEET